ncbi:MAG: hypothetical protein KJ955_01535, partial [Nanoarchaeota archaeon]|nr:hypothetical protein [Nanoarchaeota archaeon]
EKQIGSNTTNASGYAEFLFNVTDCNYQAGSQYWRAEINSSESNYNISKSGNYTISIVLTGCEATVDVYSSILTPTAAFQNRTFAVNATVTAWISTAKNVTVSINASDSYEVANKSQWYSSIGVSSYMPVTWRINATSYGTYNLNVTANSSNAGGDSLLSSSFYVYKLLPESSTGTSLPVNIAGNNETIFGWACSAGNYRVANVNATWNSSGTWARVYSYDGLAWQELVHSAYVNSSLYGRQLSVLRSQMFPNGTGYCNIKVKNIGSSNLSITNLTLLAYYEPTVKVRDIIAKIGSVETTGMEPADILFNASILIENSDTATYSINLTLNITNSSNAVVNSSIQAFSISGGTTITANFTGINVSGWSQGDYLLNAYVRGDKSDNRSEYFILKTVSAATKTVPYMCNGTIEYFNVTVVHPFNDSIEYNVSLSLPSGWSYSGSQLVTASSRRNYTVSFNLTSGSTPVNASIDAFINYTYPATAKGVNLSRQIEMSDSIPILEITRETPSTVGNSKEFYSRLVVHNKGCASATSVSFVEQVTSGWTAYEQTLDRSSAGQADIPTSQIRFASADFGTVTAGGYKVIAYKVFPPSQNAQQGSFRYNLTWGARNVYEPAAHIVTTINYTSEAHLAFNIVAIGSWKARSALPGESQAFNLSVTNIGDKNASSGEWNISLVIPADCNASNYTGAWNSTERTIIWQLGNDIVPAAETNFGFNLTCNSSGKYLLIARAINDTRQETTLVNDTGIGCTGASCASRQAFTFSKPSGVRYEKLKEVAFYISHSWSGAGLAIGEGAVNFSDDANKASLVWQKFAFNPESASEWVNFSIDTEEQSKFVAAARNISVSSYTDAISGASGNVTVEKISYVWNHGLLFSDSQPLFVSVQPYTFVPDAPLLQGPPNASTQVSSPIVLSWFPSTGASSYYVYGDTADGNTYLGTVSVTNYLWSDLESGTYKWNVKATTGTQNSTLSDTWQFTLDLCAQDPGYASYLSLPMIYDNTTDTITVIGNSTYGTPSSPVLFEDIYKFARGARGVCAVIKPATGNYVVKSRLVIGNGTQPVTLESKGQSISFTAPAMPQFAVNASARAIFGSVANGIPQEGNNIKFTSNASAGNILVDVAGGELAIYDGYVTDAGTDWGTFVYRGACGSGSNYASANSSITIKKTIFDRASRGQFFYTSNVTIDDLKINRINSSAASGYGLVLGCNVPALNNLQIYHQEQDGSAIETTRDMPNNTDIIITNSYLKYNLKDVIATANGKGVQLINTEWNRTYDWNFGGDNGTGSVAIKELYGFQPTFTDAAGAVLANVSIKVMDNFGTVRANLVSDTTGKIAEQNMPTWQVERSASGEEITSFNPYNVKIKKYGKTFVSEAKSFSARTIETKQLSANPFSNRSEDDAKALTGIRYVPPTSVNYGDESNSSWTNQGQLLHYPVAQSGFFGLFANGTKLVENTNYTVNYQTGLITFLQTMAGKEIRPVYSHGGNITLFNGATSCYTMRDIYDYMQANLSDVVSTVDGVIYTFYVGLIVGNYSTTQGCILDPNARIVFEDGFTYSFSVAGGFIDLAGITAGAGTGGGGGGLPLNIFNDVGITYAPGNTVYIFSTTLDSSGNLVNSTVNITVYYPNSSIISSGISSTQTTGRFRYNFTLPASAPEGTYRVDIDAFYLTNQVHDNLAFKVAVGSGGGTANPEIIVDAPALINVNTSFDITMLAKSGSGIAVNCDSTPTITIRDTLLGANVVSGAAMTYFATGQYNYTWRTNNQSTYLATVYCTIESTAYTGTKMFTSQFAALTPTIELAAPSVVNTNTNFAISALVRNANSQLANCTGNMSLTLTDNFNSSVILSNVVMTRGSTGQYNYSTSLSYQSTFLGLASCALGSAIYTSNPILVSSLNVPGAGGGSGVSYSTIELSASTPIATSSTAGIGALVKNASGVPANCDGSLNLTIKNLLTNSTSSGQMVSFGSGFYSYLWITPAAPSIFYVNASCTISATSYTGFTMLSTQPVNGSAGIDYNQIAVYVWNYTSRNLTYYNQSVAESMQSCLRDGSCSDWWINTTFTNIYNTVANINTTANNIKADTQNILDSLDCTDPNEMCTRLQDILNNATDIQSRVYALNTSQIPAMQSDINNIYTDTQYIRANMATASALADVQNNITWIKNNMVTQAMFEANMTEIRNRLSEINSTTQAIKTRVDCSNASLSNTSDPNYALCSYLYNINSTVNTIYSEMATYEQASNILNNVTWLRDNVATQEALANNFTEVKNRLLDMNATLWDVHNDLAGINASLSGQISNLQEDVTWVRDNVATSEEIAGNFTETFNRLNGINLTVSDTNAYLYNDIANRLTEINATTQSAYSYILGNVSTTTNITEILNRIGGVDGNLTFIKNNMFYQGNATGAFIVDYLATVYAEPGSSAGLWIATKDLLGNQKTVTEADCSILQNNAAIADATTSILPGGVSASWNIPASQASGTYYWNCTLTGSTVSIQAPFFVSTIAQQINQTISNQTIIRISDFGKISSGQQYRVKIWITDGLGRPKNASSLPTVRLYDPTRNLIVQDVSMQWEESGIYAYNFTTTGQTGGMWETSVSVVVNGATTKHGDFWELVTNPTEVTILGIPDKQIPDITAQVRITNEGTEEYEYHYEYCIVDSQNNVCGGSDDTCYGVGAIKLQPETPWTKSLTCSNTFTAGRDYWFKIVVYYDAEKSGAAQLFTAEAAAGAPAVSAPAAGGGGGAPYVPPVIKEEVEVPEVKPLPVRPVFKAVVPEAFKIVRAGGKAVVEVTVNNITEKLKSVAVVTRLLTMDEKLIAEEFSTMDMLPDTPVTRKLNVPDWLPPDKYILRSEITYMGKTKIIDNYIELTTKEEEPSEVVVYVKKLYRNLFWVGIIFLALVVIFLIILGIVIIRRRRGGPRQFRARFKPELRDLTVEADLNTRKPLVKIEHHAKHEEQHVKPARDKPEKPDLHDIIKHMKKDMK